MGAHHARRSKRCKICVRMITGTADAIRAHFDAHPAFAALDGTRYAIVELPDGTRKLARVNDVRDAALQQLEDR
jgi:hypothetical protein